MQEEKIAPGLLAVLEEYREGGRERLVPQARVMGLVAPVASPKPARTVVFVHCDDQASFDHLAAAGVRVNQPTGRVRTAFLPLESLDPLSDDPAVDRIIQSRYLRPLMDEALKDTRVPRFRTTGNLSGGGVIVGVVDTGIDSSHPLFEGRILRIWDQALPGPGVMEGGYGAELMPGMLTVSRDTHGHGTHVAGIAAGEHATFGGVAPKADLVIVKTDFQDAHIADGVRYIFRVAESLGRPAVVNLSLGGHADAHDGSDSLSQIIDDAGGPGRIVCCAAGNEGNDAIHAQASVPANRTRTVRFRVPPNTVGVGMLNGWYPSHGSCQVSLRSPGGFITPFQGPILSGSPVRSYTLPDASVLVVTPRPDPTNDSFNVFVQIRGRTAGLPVLGGVWQLRVRNTASAEARFDVWTLDDQQSPQVVFSGTSVRDSMKIGSPGCAAGAVTVASFTTKNEWTDIDGAEQAVGLELDDISDFSSEGPLRGQAQKPDLAAPGAMIVSALSADSLPQRSMRVGETMRVMAGTSMATPFVSGLIALLLERNPTLDPAGTKALLKAHTKIPGRAAGTFDPKWGFGLINATGL